MSDTSQNPASGEVLYSLVELNEAAGGERELSSFSREKMDELEIERVFKKRKQKKKKEAGDKPRQTFQELLEFSDPPIPKENLEILAEITQNGSALRGLEEAIAKDLIPARQAGHLWGTHLGVAYVNPLESIVTRDALATMPEEIARKAKVVPLYVISNVLTFATSTPEDHGLVSRISNITGMQCSPVFSLPSEVRDALEVYFASGDEILSHIKEFEQQHGYLLEDLESSQLGDIAESKPIAKIVEAILHWAIRENASDIHLEPQEGLCRIRFRVDGRLRTILSISKGIFPAITSRLKVVTNVNISESRFPQDGRFAIPLGNSKAEFRVSFLPSRHGLKTVIRILGGAGRGKMINLDEMLISQSILKPWRRIVKNPNGIIFVTGPTGSGKTTTLYATLQELNTPEVNISTIEDPIEIEMPGLTQSQVNSHIDLNFAILLRALLRQDPNIILVGEIRDKETAKIAIEAALTGHLVFATLHTNSAIQAITRLLEIGIEPYQVAPSINAVLAQRLASRLNEEHKESYRPPDEVLKLFFRDYQEAEDVLFYRPSPKLEESALGYKGRIAIHELVLVSDALRSLITAGAGTREMVQEAQKLGYRPLRHDGLKKALMGLTTLEEVERVTPMEWSV